MKYESRVLPVHGSESVFSRLGPLDSEEGKANCMVYTADSSKLEPEERLGFSAVSIPLVAAGSIGGEGECMECAS